MKDEIKKNINKIFTDYKKDRRLEGIKAEISMQLEDNFNALRQKGIIESAALKRVLADLNRALQSAEHSAKGNKQKRLVELTKRLGVSPIGRNLALARIGFSLLAVCGLVAALAFWLTRGDIAGSVAALTPFAAVACAGFTTIQLKRYRVDKAEIAAQKVLLAALASGGLTAFLLARLAAALA